MTDVTELFAQQLPALLELLQNSDVREIEVREGDLSVRLHRADAVEEEWSEDGDDVVEELIATEPMVLEITAPLVGTFYRASVPGTPPLAAEGSWVDEDTVVGIVEALHVLTDVTAGCTGVVDEVFATDGQPVEYGQVLFGVRPRG
jgi:biotin carboxyl carrier protein